MTKGWSSGSNVIPFSGNYGVAIFLLATEGLTLRLNTRPCTINVVVVYAPTAFAEDDVIDEFYTMLEGTLSKFSKS